MMRCLILFVALVFAQVRAEMEQGCAISPGEEEVYRYTGNEVQVCVTEIEQEAADPDKALLSLHISKQGKSVRLALAPVKMGDGSTLLEGEMRGTWHIMWGKRYIITADESASGSAPNSISFQCRAPCSPESDDAPSVQLPADAAGLSFPYDPALIGKDYVLIHSESVGSIYMLLGAEQFERVAGRRKISIPSARGKTYAWLVVHTICLLLLILSGAYIMRWHRAWAMLTLMLALIPGITCLSLWRSLNTDANLDARFVRECVWQKGADETVLRLMVDDSAPHMVYTGSSADQGYTRFYISTVPAGHALQPLEVKQHGSLRYIDLRIPSNHSSGTFVLINDGPTLWVPLSKCD